MTRVAFLLVPYLHLLDLAGAAQVFSSAADLGLGYEQVYLGETEQIVSTQGLVLQATTRWPRLDEGDLLVVPGWRGSMMDSSRACTR